MLKEKLHPFQLARQALTIFHSSFDECHDMNQIYYKIWTIPYNKSVPYNNSIAFIGFGVYFSWLHWDVHVSHSKNKSRNERYNLCL